MQVVARQRQKLQGIVKPPRLEMLEAEEDNVAPEDNVTGRVPRWDAASEPLGWARRESLSPRGRPRPPKGPGGSLPAVDTVASQPASEAR